MPRRRLNELVYLRNKEVVFRTSFVKTSEVDAHSLLALVLHEDWIGEQFRVKYLSDEADSKQPVDFVAEGLALLLIYLPRLLLHWPDPRVDGESVADNDRVNAQHVGGSPREHVKIVGKELIEHGLLVSGEARSNPESSFQMHGVHME